MLLSAGFGFMRNFAPCRSKSCFIGLHVFPSQIHSFFTSGLEGIFPPCFAWFLVQKSSGLFVCGLLVVVISHVGRAHLWMPKVSKSDYQISFPAFAASSFIARALSTIGGVCLMSRT